MVVNPFVSVVGSGGHCLVACCARHCPDTALVYRVCSVLLALSSDVIACSMPSPVCYCSQANGRDMLWALLSNHDYTTPYLAVVSVYICCSAPPTSWATAPVCATPVAAFAPMLRSLRLGLFFTTPASLESTAAVSHQNQSTRMFAHTMKDVVFGQTKCRMLCTWVPLRWRTGVWLSG